MYNRIQNIGVNAITRNTANNWNQKDELRAFESFTTRIKAASRSKKIVRAIRNRIGLWITLAIIHSEDVKGFQIISDMSQLHSIRAMVACVSSKYDF